MADINYIGGISLGKIKAWDSKKASTITPISFPGQNAGETEGIDTLGVIAFIDFEGQWTGTFATIQGYIASLQSIIDGAQLSSSVLRSPFVNTRTTGNVLRFGSIGVNTSVTASKLVDSGALFSSRGVKAGDIVKNMVTGAIANVTSVSGETTLNLDANIFTSSGVGYACTASMNTKLLNLEYRWELPALSICNYKISIMQVK